MKMRGDGDIYHLWREFMADISLKLRDKYGLRFAPTKNQIDLWVAETERQIRTGYSNEFSGDQAARKIFPDYKAGPTKSDADTIAELLEAAKRK
jgi:hypothetical protein